MFFFGLNVWFAKKFGLTLFLFSIPNSTSPHLKDLLYKLLKRNSSDRINFEDFSTHEFLKITQSDEKSIGQLSSDLNNELNILDDHLHLNTQPEVIKKNTFKNIHEQRKKQKPIGLQDPYESDPLGRPTARGLNDITREEPVQLVSRKHSVKENSNTKELADDYVLVFNKPTKEIHSASNTIPIPQSKNYFLLQTDVL